MSKFVERLRQAAERANTAGGWEDMELLLQPSRVLRIVIALEAADMLLDEVAQAAPLLDMFPDDLAEAMGGMRAALAALEEE